VIVLDAPCSGLGALRRHPDAKWRLTPGDGKDRRRFYAMAHGSAGEILAALDVADAWGWEFECTKARAVLDRELALTI